MKRAFVTLIVLISIVVFSGNLRAESIKVGFVSGRGLENTVKQWTPLINYLTSEVGVPFEMVFREDYESLWESLAKGEIDLYEGGGFSNVRVKTTGTAKPEVLVGKIQLGQKTYRNAFIVRSSDNVQTLADLKNKNLAFKDELSTTGYLLPRVMLARAGIANPTEYFKEVVFTGSHQRSLEALLEGAVDVATVSELFINFLSPAQRAKIRTILFSDPIPLGPIGIRSNFDPRLRQKIVEAFLNYDKKFPENMRKVMETDQFILQTDGAYDIIRSYASEFEKLPKLSDFIPMYRRVPTVFSDRINAEKKTALLWMGGTFLLLTILLTLTTLKFRQGFASSIGLVVAVIVTLLAALFTVVQITSLLSTINSFTVEQLNRLENANLRMVKTVEENHTGEFNKILLNVASGPAIASAKMFRNGTIIASSDPEEVGTSIIEQIRAGTFNLPPKGLEKQIVPIEDPVIANNRMFAMLQFGISFAPISTLVRHSIIINLLAMMAAAIAGLLTALFAKKRLARPVHAIHSAIERLREGEAAKIEGNDPDVGEVTTSLNRLGRELAEKQQLEDLKNYETDSNRSSFDPEITRELEEKIRVMERENESFKKIRATEAIGQSPAWLRVLRDAAIRARDREPVVIYGPTGSGKTGIARAIHSLSPRHNNNFGEFNCAELASGDPLVVLGKLFGYGTDSGIAGIDRHGQKGILEEFDDGTLFLDEVEILPLQAQQLLLLPLEGRPFNPAAGKKKPQTVNTRFIFATNEPLEELAHSGRMRKDLLRRILARGVVKIPNLAERSDDIEPLARHFLAQRNANTDKKLSFSREATRSLTQCNFDKYNVSELRGMVDRAFDRAHFEGAIKIEPKHLGNEFLENSGITAGQNRVGVAATDGYDEEEEQELAILRKVGFKIALAEKSLGYASGSKTLTNRFRGLVYKTLERSQWNVKTAIAEIAGPHHADYTIIKRVKAKIEDYIATARRNLESSATPKIFNNLPRKYHPSAEKFLEAISNSAIKDAESFSHES